jgi:uncharacterized protein (TIGR02145 family)
MESIKEVQIGSQIWMAENLNVLELSNGDVSKEAQSDLDWAECDANGVPAWCYYDKDDGKGAKYGKLYNQFVLNAEFNIMEGWRLPSNNDWKQLAEFLGGESVAGLSLKSKKSWVKSIKSVNLNLPVGRQVQIDKVKFFQAASFVLLFSKHITIISFFNIKIKLISLNCKVSLFRVRLFISSIDRTAKNTSRRIGT